MTSSLRIRERQRYEQIIEHYLADCYRLRTAARVSELADLLRAARPYLSRVILRLFGKPLGRVLRDRQLEEACRLLRLTPLTLDEIALAAAFGTRTTFYRLFRRHFGMTPIEYRESGYRLQHRDENPQYFRAQELTQ
jgi:AraC-like DNA-binding protein